MDFIGYRKQLKRFTSILKPIASTCLQALHEFTWGEFCDWYLELTKANFKRNYSDEEKLATKTTLIMLESLLRLLHPIVLCTEALWQKLHRSKELKRIVL